MTSNYANPIIFKALQMFFQNSDERTSCEKKITFEAKKKKIWFGFVQHNETIMFISTKFCYYWW